MAKDAYWFRHDSNAGRDVKLLKIAHIHTHWGKGIFWDVIEVLREQLNYCFSSKESDLQILASIIGCSDVPKFLSWYRDCIQIGLFIEDGDKFYSASLISRMKKWETCKDNGGKTSGNKKPKHTQSIGYPIPKAYPKHTIRGEEIREDNKSIKAGEEKMFDDFRKQYPGTKLGLPTEFSNFQKKHKDWKEILPLLETSLKSQILNRTQKAGRGEFVPEWKHLKTWINTRSWEQETGGAGPAPKRRNPSDVYDEINNSIHGEVAKPIENVRHN